MVLVRHSGMCKRLFDRLVTKIWKFTVILEQGLIGQSSVEKAVQAVPDTGEEPIPARHPTSIAKIDVTSLVL